ncbi:MAG: CapA family protein [Clostridia bacterium]|nr:CapA family protein [Clostridia bacterium]
MSEYKGNNGQKPVNRQTYVPGQGRANARPAGYPVKPSAQGTPAPSVTRPSVQSRPASSAAARPNAQARPASDTQSRPVSTGTRLPHAASNGTKYAGPGSAVGSSERPAQSAQYRPASARPAQSANSRPAQQRPAGARPAARPAPRKKQASFADLLASVFGGGNGSGMQYGRMLLIACVLVLVMFGIVKGIGALTREKEPDYILATKITDAPTTEPEQIALEPTADPTAIPVSDEGYFPEGEQNAAVQPTEQPAAAGTGRTARLRFAGDVVPDTEILATAYNSKTDKYDFSRYFDLIRDQLSNADFTSLNVDGSMGGAKHDKYGRYTGYPQFNTPPTMLYAVQGAGVDMLTLANNHCLDGWFDGLLDTIKNCDYIGMQHVGAFTSQEDYDTPEILDINGIKVGFLNYTQSFNSMDKRGVDPNALIWGVRHTSNADYEGDIQALRDAGAEVVIVVMHWGKEYLFSPDDNQVAMANRIAAAGADVIVGGHPHVFQAAGWKKTTLADGTPHECLLVYSLGNFLSEHRNEKQARTDAGIIFEFTLKENTATGEIEVVEPAYLPIAVWRVGTEGAYDYRVVSVDAVLANKPAGMNSSAYARIQQVSEEMEEVYGKSNFTRLAY